MKLWNGTYFETHLANGSLGRGAYFWMNRGWDIFTFNKSFIIIDSESENKWYKSLQVDGTQTPSAHVFTMHWQLAKGTVLLNWS